MVILIDKISVPESSDKSVLTEKLKFYREKVENKCKLISVGNFVVYNRNSDMTCFMYLYSSDTNATPSFSDKDTPVELDKAIEEMIKYTKGLISFYERLDSKRVRKSRGLMLTKLFNSISLVPTDKLDGLLEYTRSLIDKECVDNILKESFTFKDS